MNVQTSTIVDVISNRRPEVTVDPKTGMWKRIRYPELNRLRHDDAAFISAFKSGFFKPVQPCSHTKTDCLFSTSGEFVVECGVNQTGRTDAWTITAPNYEAYRAIYGGNSLNSGGSWTPKYTAGHFRKVDWFALMDSFGQSCDEFVHSSFLGGEDIAENAIFVDALKLVLNPSKAVLNLFTIVKDLVRSEYAPILTLGHLAKSYRKILKKGANADLLYKFGIRPAVSDIVDTVHAHSKVADRMAFLRQNGGSWVPIRVKQELLADSSNQVIAPLAPGVSSQYVSQCDFRKTTGTISAYGRVRPDLDWNDTWSAYLQYFGIDHMVGLAWELIPFSFVVDWFTNAKERIDHYTRLRTGGPFSSIRGLSASLKQETRLRLMMNPGYIPSKAAQISKPDSPITLATLSTVSYTRYNQIPETSGVVDLSTLGIFHGVTSGELILQRYL